MNKDKGSYLSHLALMSGQDHEENNKQNNRIGAWCRWLISQTPQSIKGHIKKQKRTVH